MLAALPRSVRDQARDAYGQFQADSSHPSLRFRQVHPTLPIYSARVSRGYRAVGERRGTLIVWFWIGPHAAYDRLLRQRP